MQTSTTHRSELVEWLNQMMATGYGGLHTSRVDSAEKKELWMRMWSNCLSGRNAKAVKWAIDQCFRQHPQPFTCADFEVQYRQAPRPKEQGRLPESVSILTRGEIQEYFDVIKEKLRLMDNPKRVTRTHRNRELGLWTEAMEAEFRRNAHELRLRVK
jgi:hypothetical protein